MNNKIYNDLINLCRHNKLKGLQSFIGQVYPINNNAGFTDWLDYHGKIIKGAGISREEVNEIIKNYQERISAIKDNTDKAELDCLANELNKYEEYEEDITSKLNYSFKPDTTFYPTIERMNAVQEKIFFQDRIDEAKAVLDLMTSNNYNKVKALINSNYNHISNKGSGSVANKNKGAKHGQKKNYSSLIKDIADEMDGKISSTYDTKTVETCLNSFLSNPKQSRTKLIESLESKIPKSDYDRLSDQVLSGWEKKLLNRINLIDSEYAQKLKRQ